MGVLGQLGSLYTAYARETWVHDRARQIYDAQRRVGWDASWENAEWAVRDRCIAQAEAEWEARGA